MPERGRTVPAARLLVERGLLPDVAQATAWIMAGEVRADGAPVRRAGDRLPEAAHLEVRGLGAYASRGGQKLMAALERYGVSPSGRTALDCGASSGGFTDCLLRQGASRVYAVDVGYGQLVGRLRQDPRVLVMERVNLSDVPPLDPAPDLVTLDLSYLSLRVAVPLAAARLSPGGEILALVKPLFEAPLPVPVTDAAAYGPVLRGLLEDLGRSVPDLCVLGLSASPVRGSGGTQEFWLHLGPEGGGSAHPPGGWAAVAAAEARALAAAGTGVPSG